MKEKLKELWKSFTNWLNQDIQVLALAGERDAELRAIDFAGYIVSSDPLTNRLSELSRIEESTPAIKRRSSDSAQEPIVIFDEYNEERRIDLQAVSARGLGGGRTSVDSEQDVRLNAMPEMMAFHEGETSDIFDLSDSFIKRLKPSKVMELLSDLSPELSRALSDFLVMCNPGWEAKALSYQTDEQDESAQDLLDQMTDKLEELHTSSDLIFNKLFQSAFLRGALASELVLDKRGRDFVDIAVVDPNSLIHKRRMDPVRGPVWRTYQRSADGTLISLDIPQFSYVPLNPHFKSNRGRPIAQSALFVCFFLIATLQDLRRVIRQQGYPRIDITVDLSKLKAMLPATKQGDVAKIKTLGNEIVREVQEVYRKLKPDDTYIHSEVVTVNQPVGALNANSLGAIDGLIKGIERMATRALKTMPLLMATTDGVSEANANRQWEIYAQFVKSIQHFVEKVLEKHFTLALQAAGVQAYCEFRFSELRASEMLRDAQVEQLKTTTARMQYDNGSINADEMAQASAGKETADVPEPRAGAGTLDPNNIADVQPEPGANRGFKGSPEAWSMMQALMQNRITPKDVQDAAALWREHARENAKPLIDAEIYTASEDN